MLSPKQQRCAARLQELIDEGKRVSIGFNHVDVYAWLTKTENSFFAVFGPQSVQFKQYKHIESELQGIKNPIMSNAAVQNLQAILGLLIGAGSPTGNRS
jgi:hypothetical protein